MEFVKIGFQYSEDVTVINKEQFDVHMRLYEGYINKMNEIDKLLMENNDLKDANATYSKYRGIKRGETFALNGVILHELYFSNIGGGEIQPDDTVKNYLSRDFGSFEKWQEEFVATAKASRGWVTLAYDVRSKKFRNISLDAHDVGNIAFSTPILVLDVYEHAYFLQYGDKKADYINNFMKNIEWNVIKDRMK